MLRAFIDFSVAKTTIPAQAELTIFMTSVRAGYACMNGSATFSKPQEAEKSRAGTESR